MSVLTGRSNDDLEIAEDAAASLEFMRVRFCNVPAAVRQRVREELEVYRQRDNLVRSTRF